MGEMLNGGQPLFESKNLTEIEQLFAIFHVMGTPCHSQWPEMCSSRYFNCAYPMWHPADLRGVVSGLNSPAMALLRMLLCVDPKHRLSCRGALQATCFRSHTSR